MIKPKKRKDLWGPMTDEDAEAVMAAMIPMVAEMPEEVVLEEPKAKKKKAKVEEPAPTFLSDIKDL